jgi:alkylation response protein AidB-like acyl-CoA dehydrogenase
MDAVQPAPQLENQYRDDPVLRAHLARVLPAAMLQAIEPDLDALGAHAAAAWSAARARTPATPVLTQWDPWGARIDRIETTPAWREGPWFAARYGLVAAGHDVAHGAHARTDQFARVYLHHVASEFHTCPLAMSDGAATVIRRSGNTRLVERALPRLLARDPDRLWLSGQWMTEIDGGSDVGRTATVARRDEHGRWKLHGRKWFTSAVVGEMALTLARPEGAAEGADALALFFLETRDARSRWNGIRIDRLKDKLGTRELPTAEIHLEGCVAEPVGELAHGVRQIAPMLNVTRTWNAVCALATMRRCLALAIDHAARRHAFGRALLHQPLHRATLGRLAAGFEAAFGLVFFAVALLGRVEAGHAAEGETALLRVLTPLAKLWTGRLAVATASETCEAFGGAGYIENTGIPLLLRDAQVYPIWEGTTNVLALDVLRALGPDGFDAFERAARELAGSGESAAPVGAGLAAARAWLAGSSTPEAREAGARGFAFTLARTFAAALLAERADAGDDRARAALAVFGAAGLVRLAGGAPADFDALLAK